MFDQKMYIPILIIMVFLFMPLALFWSLNMLFKLGIAYTASPWFAAWLAGFATWLAALMIAINGKR